MDGPQHPLNAFLRVLGGSPTLSEQLVQQAPPLGAENVSARQAAVPADDTQVGDAVFHQVAGGTQAPGARGEGFAAGTADHRPTLRRENGTGGTHTSSRRFGEGVGFGCAVVEPHQLDDVGDTEPVGLLDVVSPLHQPLVALWRSGGTVRGSPAPGGRWFPPTHDGEQGGAPTS